MRIALALLVFALAVGASAQTPIASTKPPSVGPVSFAEIMNPIGWKAPEVGKKEFRRLYYYGPGNFANFYITYYEPAQPTLELPRYFADGEKLVLRTQLFEVMKLGRLDNQSRVFGYYADVRATGSSAAPAEHVVWIDNDNNGTYETIRWTTPEKVVAPEWAR